MQAFLKRIRQYVSLSDDSWSAFDTIAIQTQDFRPEETIVHTGDQQTSLFIIEEGWAMRYRLLEDGRRQIVNFMMPGDIFDLQCLADLEADHSVTAITAVKTSVLSKAPFLRMLRSDADLASGFWWAAVQEESILREQIVRIGRRSARERMGHILLELRRRYLAATGDSGDSFEFPLTRAQLADALGLTVVHVSRTMSALKRAGLIEETQTKIRLKDLPKLRRLSQFDDQYLHSRALDLSQRLTQTRKGDDLTS